MIRKKEGDHLCRNKINHTMFFKIFALCDFFIKIWSIQVVDNWVILDGNVMYGKYLYAIIVVM